MSAQDKVSIGWSRDGEARFVGLDLTAGRRLVDMAVLDSRLNIELLQSLPLEQALQLLLSGDRVVAAIDAPQQTSAGLLSDPHVREQHGLKPSGPTWQRYRISEFELRHRGLNLYVTPQVEGAAPEWMRVGFRVYRRLRSEGYALGQDGSGGLRWCFEVHPHACFAALLGRIPFAKGTLEGRLQRQILLFREGVQVPDPMHAIEELTAHHLLLGDLSLEGLCSHDALDALVAAYTAYLASRSPERVSWMGDPADGFICLPANPVADSYRR
jgi:hypothetical protein